MRITSTTPTASWHSTCYRIRSSEEHKEARAAWLLLKKSETDKIHGEAEKIRDWFDEQDDKLEQYLKANPVKKPEEKVVAVINSNKEDSDEDEDDSGEGDSDEEIDGSDLVGFQDESGVLHIEDVDVDGNQCYQTYYQADNGDLVQCDGSTEDVWEDLPATNDAEDRLARKYYEEDLKKTRLDIEGANADLDLISQEASSTYGDFECYFGAKARARSAVRGNSGGKGRGRGKGKGRGNEKENRLAPRSRRRRQKKQQRLPSPSSPSRRASTASRPFLGSKSSTPTAS